MTDFLRIERDLYSHDTGHWVGRLDANGQEQMGGTNVNFDGTQLTNGMGVPIVLPGASALTNSGQTIVDAHGSTIGTLLTVAQATSLAIFRASAQNYVADYGGVPDGTTDNNLVSGSILTGQSNRKVFVPPGVYLHSGGFNATSQNVIMAAIPGTVTFLFPNSGAGINWPTGGQNQRFYGIGFAFTHSDTNGTNFAFLNLGNNSTRSDVEFEKCDFTSPNSTSDLFKVVNDSGTGIMSRFILRDCGLHDIGGMVIECTNHGTPPAVVTRQRDFIMEDNRIENSGCAAVATYTVSASPAPAYANGFTTLYFTDANFQANPSGTITAGNKSWTYFLYAGGVPGTGTIKVLGDRTTATGDGSLAAGTVVTATLGNGYGLSISGDSQHISLRRNIFDDTLSTAIEVIGPNQGHIDENHFRCTRSTLSTVWTNTADPTGTQTSEQVHEPLFYVDTANNVVGILSNVDKSPKFGAGESVRIYNTLTTVASAPTTTAVTINGRAFVLTLITLTAMDPNARAMRGTNGLSLTNTRITKDLIVRANVCDVPLNGCDLDLRRCDGAFFEANIWRSWYAAPASGGAPNLNLQDSRNMSFNTDKFYNLSTLPSVMSTSNSRYPLGTRHNKWNQVLFDNSGAVNAGFFSLAGGTRDNEADRCSFVYDITGTTTAFGLAATTISTCNIAMSGGGAATATATVSGSSASNNIRPGQMVVGDGTNLPAFGLYLIAFGTNSWSSCVLSGSTCTVGGTQVGLFGVGQTLAGTGIPAGTTVSSIASGTGGSGTVYNLSAAVTSGTVAVSSTSIGGDGNYTLSHKYSTTFAATAMSIVDQGEPIKMRNCDYSITTTPGSLVFDGTTRRFADQIDTAFVPWCDSFAPYFDVKNPWGGYKYFCPLLNRNITVENPTTFPHQANAANGMFYEWEFEFVFVSDASARTITFGTNWNVAGSTSFTVTSSGTAAQRAVVKGYYDGSKLRVPVAPVFA